MIQIMTFQGNVFQASIGEAINPGSIEEAINSKSIGETINSGSVVVQGNNLLNQLRRQIYLL